jgi:hypothetical protein
MVRNMLPKFEDLHKLRGSLLGTGQHLFSDLGTMALAANSMEKALCLSANGLPIPTFMRLFCLDGFRHYEIILNVSSLKRQSTASMLARMIYGIDMLCRKLSQVIV